jgi:hypothetical protein
MYVCMYACMNICLKKWRNVVTRQDDESGTIIYISSSKLLVFPHILCS